MVLSKPLNGLLLAPGPDPLLSPTACMSKPTLPLLLGAGDGRCVSPPALCGSSVNCTRPAALLDGERAEGRPGVGDVAALDPRLVGVWVGEAEVVPPARRVAVGDNRPPRPENIFCSSGDLN